MSDDEHDDEDMSGTLSLQDSSDYDSDNDCDSGAGAMQPAVAIESDEQVRSGRSREHARRTGFAGEFFAAQLSNSWLSVSSTPNSRRGGRPELLCDFLRTPTSHMPLPPKSSFVRPNRLT